MNRKNMPSIPKKIENMFTVGEQIGKGSFGDVYEGEKNDGSKVAIKFEEWKKDKKNYLEIEIQVNNCLFLLRDTLKNNY